jgi:hypothetical protein
MPRTYSYYRPPICALPRDSRLSGPARVVRVCVTIITALVWVWVFVSAWRG